jgi:hypothetical protein
MNLKEYYKARLEGALLSEGPGGRGAGSASGPEERRFTKEFSGRAHAQGRQVTPSERAALVRHAQNDSAAAKRAAAQAAARRAGGQSQG